MPTDSRAGDPGEYSISSGIYITSGCKSVTRKVGDRLELRCNPRAGSQSRPTADLDGHCGPTCGRRESDPPALPGLLAVRHGRSQTNEISRMSLFPTATKRTTRRFLVDLHRRYQLDGVEFLVDDASYLGPITAEDGSRSQTLAHGDRSAVKVYFERYNPENIRLRIFLHVEIETAENRFEAFAASRCMSNLTRYS